MYLYIELLKVAILIGIMAKAAGARSWAGALAAAAIAYTSVALFAIVVFEQTWPLLSTILGATPTRAAVLAVLAVQAVASGVMWQVGSRRHGKGSPGREAADLFVLPAVITVGQVGLALLL